MSHDDQLQAELATASWRRATKTGQQGNCAEVAPLSGGRVGLRNSTQPELAPLVFTAAEWDAFMDGARKGEFSF